MLTRVGLALTLVLSGGIVLGRAADRASAAPAPPVRVHPRLFLDADTLDGLRAAAARPGSATAAAIAGCDDVIAHPGQWQSGGYQGLGFIEPLSDCLVAWAVRGDPADAQTAATYFRALLDDYQTLGDGAGGDTAVQHDDGYPMRSFGPYAAIAYDWLHDAPGVDGALLAHARDRFKAWTDWYGSMGYHRSEAGANYHAGYVFAATTIAIAEAGEAGAGGDALWGHVVDDIFAGQLAPALAPGGVLDGGDWLEGWQYGPLSVAEYALSARALRGAGVPLAGYSAWEGQLMARTIFATVPDGSAGYVGGDTESSTPNNPIDGLTLAAALVDAAPDDAAAWAAQAIADRGRGSSSFPLVAVLAEARAPAPQPFPTDASTWYYAAGSRTLYARTDWSAQAVWMVSQCASRRISDHMLIDAGNVVLTRGGDDLIVDPSPYGSLSTVTGNAPTVASPQLPAEYQPSQGFWGTDATVDFRWARQTMSGVVAARCDYAGQYRFQDKDSDIARAVRDLVLVPYGQGDAVLVLVDDVDGAATDRPLELRLRSTGTFAGGAQTRATVGGSDVVVQTAYATAGTAAVDTPPVGDCGSAPRGQCTAARFGVSEWHLEVGAARAQAITVVDAAAAGSDPGAATSTSGTGWRATELDRGGSHLAVVAVDPGLTTVTYTAAPGTHVVVGAPAGSAGRADVSAAASAGGCDVTVAARDGDGGLDARPVVIDVAADCAVTEDPARPGFAAPTGDDPPPGPGGGPSGSIDAGCCQAGGPSGAALPLVVIGLALGRPRRRRRRG
jgi:hypothetical protein